MSSVEFEKIAKTYSNGHQAISALDLSVADGELMVMIGPSGCGKSTLLRLVAGLEDVTGGTIRIGGRPAQGLSPGDRNIAMVFQDYALYPTMTVRENLSFPLRMRRLPKDEIRRKVAWTADLLDLGQVLERLPKQLSGGQRQRVAMGRALVREPSVFLLDEPLSNLDAKLRVQVRTEISELQRCIGATMIYVTHDQTEAMTLGQRIAVLNHGRLQQIATPAELYANPANAFVAGFIGTPPMNVFKAAVADEGGVLHIRFYGQTIATSDYRSGSAGLAAGASQIEAGIRPEALALVPECKGGFAAKVTATEFLGHETLVHFQPLGASELEAGSSPWIARLTGRQDLPVRSQVYFAVAPDGVHFFQP